MAGVLGVQLGRNELLCRTRHDRPLLGTNRALVSCHINRAQQIMTVAYLIADCRVLGFWWH